MDLCLMLNACWELTYKYLNISWQFEKVIGETFAIIAGFVAIGIPLALQIAHAISEKYDNPLLIKRAASGSFITPVMLVVVTIAYLSLALVFKIISVKTEGGEELFALIVFEKIILLLFTLILFWTAVFYIRLYRKILEPAHSFLPKLLQLRKKRWQKYIDRIVKKEIGLRFYEAFVNSFYYSSKKPYRIPRKKIDSVAAGLEVLAFKLETKVEDESFQVILSEFNRFISDNYFGCIKERYRFTLNDDDFFVLEMYWRFLLKIVRVVRSSENNKLSFTVQRYLASLISLIIHCPQYERITAESYLDESGINWRQDIFELARWQSNQDSKGVDLVLECEWISSVNSFVHKPDLRFSSIGAAAALDTVKSIFQYSCKVCPDKTTIIYKNLVESLPYRHDIDIPISWCGGKFWAYNYLSKIVDKKYSLSNAQNWILELKKVGSSRVFRDYGEHGISKAFSEREINELFSAINYSHLYEQAYMYSIQRIGLEMMGSMAYFKRWEEFEFCLNWRQPTSANASYVGNNFFPESVKELFKLLVDHEVHYLDNVFFHEREGLKEYIIKASAFILKWLIKQSQGELSVPSLNPVEHNKSFCKTLTLIIVELSEAKAPPNDKFMALLQDRLSTFENSMSLQVDNFSSGKINLKEHIGKNYIFGEDSCLKLFNIEPSLKVLEPEVLFCKLRFQGGLSGYDGLDIYIQFLSLIFREIKSKAKKVNFSSISDLINVVVFSNEQELKSLGFRQPEHGMHQTRYWHHTERMGWKGILTNSPDVYIVTPDRFKIIASHFESGFGSYPFLMVMHQKHDSLLVENYAYLSFNFEDNSAFKL